MPHDITMQDTLAEFDHAVQTVEADTLSAPVNERHQWPTVLGLKLAPFTFEQALRQVERLVAVGEPAYFITANLHYAYLCAHDARLRRVNNDAAFLLADGMPLVWAARRRACSLPGRVAGSDLTPALCELAAQRGFRVALFGARPEVAAQAAANLRQRHAGIEIVDVFSPEPADVEPSRDRETIERIRLSSPDLLLVALGQPKGELWIHRNYRRLGPVVTVQIGATLDFIAGEIPRAPRWMQRVGLEWLFRMAREPLRLGPRYAQDIRFLTEAALRARL